MPDQPQKTALHALHKQLGGRMAPFGGWDMPIEYSGIIEEHLAVRTAAGLFDVSHMGEIIIEGPEALAYVQHLTCNDASRLQDGQIQYSALLYPQGTFVDDILVHRISANRFFLCVNASNTTKDFQWIEQQNKFQAAASNLSHQYSQLAIQGPKALAILQRLTALDLSSIKYYWFKQGAVLGIDAIVSRTGYTGEDGFELYFHPEHSEKIWTALLDAGKGDGLIPVGLGARNTLRLEAAMSLYGHEISDQLNPWEANLAWIVKLDKGGFIGKAALETLLQQGLTKKLAGFETLERGIARDTYPVLVGGQQAGYVTSGGPAPYLKKNIGLAYVPADSAQLGSRLEIQVRSNRVPAQIVAMPFYKKPSKISLGK
jgi:aminomethyltransferase